MAEDKRHLEIEQGDLVFIRYNETNREGRFMGVIGFNDPASLQRTKIPDNCVFLRKGRFVAEDGFIDVGTYSSGCMEISPTDEVFNGAKEIEKAFSEKFGSSYPVKISLRIYESSISSDLS